MKTIEENKRLSLTECKKILNKNGNKYTDAEILAIRDWLYFFSELTYEFIEEKTNEEVSQIAGLMKSKK